MANKLQRLLYPIRKTFHPEWYQGHARRQAYFEGWYFKLVSHDTRAKIAVIPGISRASNPDESHAFIQVFDGTHGRVHYFTFPLNHFSADHHQFKIRVGPNHFGRDGMTLNLEREKIRIAGEVSWSGQSPWPISWLSPGVMGWYAWVPKMECYHGVVSMNHQLRGTLSMPDGLVDFNQGKGYTEKDWGTSFPSDWIWAQSNHFSENGTSFFFSLAKIPWLGRYFIGFISGLQHVGRLYRFATYTGARMTKLRGKDNTVEVEIQTQRHVLRLKSVMAQTTALPAPQEGVMRGHVRESLDSVLDVRLESRGRNRRVLFQDTGQHAGLEVHGDLDVLAEGSDRQ